MVLYPGGGGLKVGFTVQIFHRQIFLVSEEKLGFLFVENGLVIVQICAS